MADLWRNGETDQTSSLLLIPEFIIHTQSISKYYIKVVMAPERFLYASHEHSLQQDCVPMKWPKLPRSIPAKKPPTRYLGYYSLILILFGFWFWSLIAQFVSHFAFSFEGLGFVYFWKLWCFLVLQGYFGIEQSMFFFNCTQCSVGIATRTDPRYSRVACEAGATQFDGHRMPLLRRLHYEVEVKQRN